MSAVNAFLQGDAATQTVTVVLLAMSVGAG